jgi:hypothetical protein
LPEVRQAQAELAKKYGIYGFCYYHYWFNGKRILERPFQEVFESGKPDFPFMLCWANENWTRVWDGGENKVLLKQEYSVEDDVKHINALIPYFKDKRYIKINGRPVFAIYRDSLFPDIKSTLKIFRDECSKQGIDIYLCRFERGKDTSGGDPSVLGFNAAIEFQPLSVSQREYLNKKKTNSDKNVSLKKYIDFFKRKVLNKQIIPDVLIDYPEFVRYDVHRQHPSYKLFPGVSPGFDNSCRRIGMQATIFKNSSPQVFKAWVESKVRKFKPYSPEENFLFINAWNEWAEGNHLEPCEKYGHQYLEALYEGIKGTDKLE